MIAKQVLCLCTILLSSDWVFASPLMPPPPPRIAPIISESYSSDQDGDKIDDELGRRLNVASTTRDLAITGLDEEMAERALDERVEVELIFKQQVTQQQIDRFLRLGGEISYIYKAVSYGWQGRIALGIVDSLPQFMGDAGSDQGAQTHAV